MSYSEYLKNTLKPLGIYELDTGAGAAELEALGTVMDETADRLSAVARDMLPMTAEEEGLSKFEGLFPGTSAASGLEARRTAVNTLIRIGECECSEQGLNNVLSSCGIPAEVSETGTKDLVKVAFLVYQLTEEELRGLKRRIEAILPCHLEIEYE